MDGPICGLRRQNSICDVKPIEECQCLWLALCINWHYWSSIDFPTLVILKKASNARKIDTMQNRVADLIFIFWNYGSNSKAFIGSCQAWEFNTLFNCTEMSREHVDQCLNQISTDSSLSSWNVLEITRCFSLPGCYGAENSIEDIKSKTLGKDLRALQSVNEDRIMVCWVKFLIKGEKFSWIDGLTASVI